MALLAERGIAVAKLTKKQIQERNESAEQLRHWLTNARMVPAEGSNRDTRVPEVLCLVTHVSASGMSRDIRLFYVVQKDTHDGQADLQEITGLVRDVLRMPVGKDGRGVRISGCGMDMTYAIVTNLSQALYGNAYSLRRSNIT